MPITCSREENLKAEEFLAVLHSSGLAARRPVDDRPRVEKLLAGSDLIIVARNEDGKAVGVSRCVTDWAYCLYCSDLAVEKSVQGLGVGKALLSETVRQSPEVKTHFLLSAPESMSFYSQAGYEALANGFKFHIIS